MNHVYTPRIMKGTAEAKGDAPVYTMADDFEVCVSLLTRDVFEMLKALQLIC